MQVLYSPTSEQTNKYFVKSTILLCSEIIASLKTVINKHFLVEHRSMTSHSGEYC